jgi:uncharacterized protein (DUF1330 family)
MDIGPVYALNLLNVKDREEYRVYVKRSAAELKTHGGKVIAIGKLREAREGEISPRQVMVLVEWESRQALQSYIDDPELAGHHPHRINGTSDYIWHFFDKLEDFRPILK